MTASRALLVAIYAAVALLALVATWHQNLAYLGGASALHGVVQFWRETLAAPASVSITVDLFLFGLAVVVWMLAEARRLGIRFVWAYVVLGAAVAISVSVPLFLIARERRLQTLRRDDAPVRWSRGDLVGLIAFGVPVLALSIWSLLH
jgi:hypothetical protein